MKGTSTERCPGCGDRFSPLRHPYRACSLVCAAEVLIRIQHEAPLHGRDWKDYLPADQRPDLVPWDAWQAASKLHGRKRWRSTKTG